MNTVSPQPFDDLAGDVRVRFSEELTAHYHAMAAISPGDLAP
ncbi:MAG TPA: hypothetical protein VEV13_00265 [Candidatus Limnocylindria bacterium]|nr:hypothetical protein [Candidatus Limnocylindria bacterium]